MDQPITVLKDLLMIMAFSGVFAIIFHYLKLPLLLGYMVGGFIVGPHSFLHLVPASVAIDQLGELGVIFLMFYIGLEFDLLKLRKIFFRSAVWLTLQVAGMMVVGIMAANKLGWSGANGKFLGAMLSVSSTMVTVPLLKAKNALNTEYAQCSIGALILEDILSIILLVILPSIGGSSEIDASQIWKSSGVIVVFVAMVFCFGKLSAPCLVKILFRSSSKEVLVVAAIGFTTAICLLAEKFNFSVALGAFLSGSIFSQTHIADDLDKSTESLRDVFNAVFFTTTGMMIDAQAILHLFPVILVLSAITFLGKILIGTSALFVLGKTTETSFKSALANAQIGEFSFVIAALGMKLGVLDKDFMSVTVGVSLFTILLCSAASKKSDSIFGILGKLCPRFIAAIGAAYHNLLRGIKSSVSVSEIVRDTIGRLSTAALWVILLCGMMYISTRTIAYAQTGEAANVLGPTISFIEHTISKIAPMVGIGMIAPEKMDQYTAWTVLASLLALAFLLCLPFLAGIVKNIVTVLRNLMRSALGKYIQNKAVSAVLWLIQVANVVMILFIFSEIFLYNFKMYIPSKLSPVYLLACLIVLAVVGWRKVAAVTNSRLEAALVESFNDTIEAQEQIDRRALLRNASKENAFNVDIKEITAKANYDIIGKRVSDIKLREITGATLVAINRSGMTTYRLTPDTQIFPNDRLVIVGTNEQLENAKELLKTEATDEHAVNRQGTQFDVLPFCIGSQKDLVGKLLFNLDLRQKYGVNIVSIQRGNTSVSEITPDTELREDDVLLLVGANSQIESFKHDFSPEKTADQAA